MTEEIVAPVLGTPEYDAAMALKAEQTMNQPAERPAELPEKFQTIGDMAKAYAELEKKLGQAPADPPAAPVAPAPAAPAEGTVDEAKAIVADAGLDYSALGAEYAANGALTEESYKTLEAKGIPKNIVDSYIAGQVALGQAIESEAHAAVGGAEEYAKMTEWAGTNMTAAEVAAFNKATNGTKEELLLAVSGLRNRYQSANGITPSLLSGGMDSGSVTGGFNSKAEMTAAIRDPRYAKDEAYRKQVENKIAATPN